MGISLEKANVGKLYMNIEKTNCVEMNMQNSMGKNYIKMFRGLIIAYITMVLLGFAGIYCAHCIPFERIKVNVDSSGKLIHNEGYYDVLRQDFNLSLTENTNNNAFTLDGWSESVMLMETCNTGHDNVLENSIKNGMMKRRSGESPYDYIHEYTNMKGDKGIYGRYWHGYLVTLIPILTIMDLSQIRILNMCLFAMLICGIIYLSAKKIDKATAAIFAFTMGICIFFPVVPYSMQFSSMFYVGLCSALCLLCFENLWKDKIHSFVGSRHSTYTNSGYKCNCELPNNKNCL